MGYLSTKRRLEAASLLPAWVRELNAPLSPRIGVDALYQIFGEYANSVVVQEAFNLGLSPVEVIGLPLGEDPRDSRERAAGTILGNREYLFTMWDGWLRTTCPHDWLHFCTHEADSGYIDVDEMSVALWAIHWDMDMSQAVACIAGEASWHELMGFAEWWMESENLCYSGRGGGFKTLGITRNIVTRSNGWWECKGEKAWAGRSNASKPRGKCLGDKRKGVRSKVHAKKSKAWK